MKREPIDQFAAEQSDERRTSVRLGSKAGHEKRTQVLREDYADVDLLRKLAGQIKQHTLEHLDSYLEKAEEKLRARGVKVHFAL
ncbi:MAG TPA: iron-sulfur cluster-binding protein, partial [Casimicrobiaceae bacterium]